MAERVSNAVNEMRNICTEEDLRNIKNRKGNHKNLEKSD